MEKENGRIWPILVPWEAGHKSLLAKDMSMNESSIRHIEGEDRGHIMLYALSTCMWCRKTKQLLDDLGVAYDVVDVDLLEEPEQEEVSEQVGKWNPGKTFPTVVINDDRCIIGYNPDELQTELKK